MKDLDDLEITRLCAEAMEPPGEHLTVGSSKIWSVCTQFAPVQKKTWSVRSTYNPLHDDAQAMALDDVILKAGYCISYESDECEIYGVGDQERAPAFFWRLDMTKAENRRRVRCECVAKMQAKHGG